MICEIAAISLLLLPAAFVVGVLFGRKAIQGDRQQQIKPRDFSKK